MVKTLQITYRQCSVLDTWIHYLVGPKNFCHQRQILDIVEELSSELPPSLVHLPGQGTAKCHRHFPFSPRTPVLE